MNIKSKYIKAEQIYKDYLKGALERRYKGKIVAIDIDSKEYFVGESEVSAYEKASRRFPKKQFCFLRVGYNFTDFLGEFR